MPSVFLSYSREDLPLIQQLEARLKEHPGLSIWRDQEKIYGGQKWPKVLGEAIADQDVFLLAWSKNAKASHFVEFEWCTAIALKKTIVPWLLDDTPLAASLTTFHGYGLDEVAGLIKSLQIAPLGDRQRRKLVIERLSKIIETEEKTVLDQAKTIFRQQQWIVQVNVYQAKRDIHIHETSIPSQTITELKNFGITEAALANFFKILDQKQVSINDLDHELRTIAHNYLDLKTRVAQLSSDDPEIIQLLQAAQLAVEAMDFPLAEQLFNQASQRDEEASHHLQQVAATRLASAASAQAANGDVRAIQLDFRKAQEYYQKALALLPPTNTEHQGQYLLKLGNALQEEGVRTGGTSIRKLLEEAIAIYHAALAVFSVNALPQDWARAQNDLGRVLWAQGIRTSGQEGCQLLANAVAAYYAALSVRTKDKFPQDWGRTQTNLGIVLWDQANRANGEASTQLLAQAVEAYGAALTIFTKDTSPRDWARTQNSLRHTY